MQEPPTWASLSQELLVAIFERQHNALDNCAAACTCSSWRQAVNNTHIRTLHLHADRASFRDHWRAFLASRSFIEHLAFTHQDFELDLSSEPTVGGKSCWAEKIPATAVSVDTRNSKIFSQTVLQHYVEHQTAGVTQLKLSYCKDYDFPSLAHLSRLLSLQLFQDADLDNLHSQCPPSLQELEIDIDQELTDDAMLSLPTLLQGNLKGLTHLVVQSCYVTLQLGGLTGLSSLSIRYCSVEADGVCFTMLTRLTCLDLYASTWYDDDGQTCKAMTSFPGWPALQVLEVVSCNLFDGSTQSDMHNLQQLKTDWPVPDIAAKSFGLVLGHTTSENASEVHAALARMVRMDLSSVLVELHLMLHDGDRDSRSETRVASLLQHCKALQVLRVAYADVVDIVLSDDCGECLRKLELRNCAAHVLDLQRATCLTLLAIEADDSAGFLPDASTPFTLPSVLQAFFYKGKHLLRPESHGIFLNCLQLNMIGLKFLDWTQSAPFSDLSIPLLPSSLRKLHLGCDERLMLLSDCNWQCLQACSNLEHLELQKWGHSGSGSAALLAGQLKDWVVNARHLHVVNFGMDAVLKWQDQIL